jgi:hypothetical protein
MSRQYHSILYLIILVYTLGVYHHQHCHHNHHACISEINVFILWGNVGKPQNLKTWKQM